MLGLSLDKEYLRERMQAAWLGRCAGCNLGKPVEGWDRQDIFRYLELARVQLSARAHEPPLMCLREMHGRTIGSTAARALSLD